MKVSNILYILFIAVFNSSLIAQTPEYTISFQITDQYSGYDIENAQVSITPCACGGVTNRNGSLTLDLPKNNYTITVSYIGFKKYVQQLELNRDTLLEIGLTEEEQQLSEVVLRAKRVNENIESPQMGTIQIKAADLKKLPTALGEFDVLKSMTLVAGVNNAGDVSNGLSVRGGSLDQNLLLYEYAPIFYPMAI